MIKFSFSAIFHTPPPPQQLLNILCISGLCPLSSSGGGKAKVPVFILQVEQDVVKCRAQKRSPVKFGGFLEVGTSTPTVSVGAPVMGKVSIPIPHLVARARGRGA